MRKLVITAILLVCAFILPGVFGTLSGIAAGIAATTWFFTAPRTQKLLMRGAEKYVADEKRKKKAEDWIHGR